MLIIRWYCNGPNWFAKLRNLILNNFNKTRVLKFQICNIKDTKDKPIRIFHGNTRHIVLF
jgi:hypothetical protein